MEDTKMAKIYYQEDCNLSLLEGKTIAVIGYGSQGHAHILFMLVEPNTKLFLCIISALNERRTADITNPLHLAWVVADMIDRAAVLAHTAACDAIGQSFKLHY